MTDEVRTTPNSFLGDVDWSIDPFWGTMEFVTQEMLGMNPRPLCGYEERFLRALEQPDQLWDWFHPNEMEGGKLGLFITTSDMGGDWIGYIETQYRYDEEISDEEFQRLIKDFVAYARIRPIVDQNAREGASITDNDIERMTMHETLEEHDFWTSLQSWVKEDFGLPHYLWLESLEFQQPEPKPNR